MHIVVLLDGDKWLRVYCALRAQIQYKAGDSTLYLKAPQIRNRTVVLYSKLDCSHKVGVLKGRIQINDWSLVFHHRGLLTNGRVLGLLASCSK